MSAASVGALVVSSGLLTARSALLVFSLMLLVSRVCHAGGVWCPFQAAAVASVDSALIWSGRKPDQLSSPATTTGACRWPRFMT